MPSIFKPIAIPTAWAKPSPTGPEEVSIPGKDKRWGCPCKREFNFLKVLNSSFLKYPA